MTNGKTLLLGLAMLGLGAAGYWGFQASGLEGFSSGIASTVLLTLLVVGWTSSYLVRVVSGRMTYMEQRRRYRAAYDQLTDEQLLAKFAALSPEEQARLLAEVGPLDPTP